MSKETTFTIKKAYALSAIDKTGKRVYYDVDSYSGGYPYWSSSFNQWKTWDSLDKVPTLDSESYMRNDVTKIEIIDVEIRARVVQTTELISEAKAKYMAEIAKIEEELARKISALKSL